ncbi:hypothetical protein Tco_0871190 [Tanacetum coccineum]
MIQGCAGRWEAIMPHMMALLTTEAGCMTFIEDWKKEAIWLKGLLEETKHINVRCHFIREVLEAKTVEVLKVGTEHNAADAITKVVPRHKLQHCLELLSVGIS